MSKQNPWPIPDTLVEARALYADLEAQYRDVDREAREMARVEREKPARLRSASWIRQADELMAAIIEAQERLVARYGDAVKRTGDLPESEASANE
jgi:ABC-type tungstate transport system substrate-binding protein